MATISMSSIATAWKGKIVWSYTQDINSNMSTVHAVVSTWKTDSLPSSSESGAYFSGTLYVGDRSIGFSFQQQNAASEGNPQYQVELEVPIVHKNDGSASVYIYCQIDAPAGVSMYNKPLKGGGTYSLATIPRESSITAAGDMYFGSPCSITWTPASSSFHYKIKMSVGSWSYTTSVISPNTTNSYTYDDYTIPLNLASQFPDSNSGIINVSLYSYSDKSCQTQVGSVSTASFTVLIPSNVVPRITSYSASFDNSTNDTINSWGVGLVGYSAVKLTASAVGSNGSTISSFEITGSYEANPIAKYQNEEDKTNAYLEYTGSVFATSGNKEFTIRCVDSRGRKSNPIEIKNMISVLPYTKPNVLSVSVTKDDRGTSNAEDDKMIVTAVWEYDPISHNGVNHNYASGVVYYKESNAKTWTPHPGTIYNNIPFMLYDMTLSDTKSYNIKVVVTDAVGGYGDKSAFSSTAQVLLDFRSGGKGLGIGKICENDGMEVLMNSTFYNEIFLMRESHKYDIDTYIKLLAKEAFDSQKSSLFGEIYPIGSIYTSISETSPKDLFGVGDWERIKDVFLFGAIDLSDLEDPNNMDDPETRYLPGEQWGEKEHTLTVDELPKHCHWGVTRPDYSKKAGTHPSPVMNGILDNFPETDDEGENQPHNNMPPYLAVYMWKRVA